MPPAWNAEERPFCSLRSDACRRSPAHRLGHTSAGKGAPRRVRLQPRRIGLQPRSHMVTGADKWWVLLRADANSALLLEASQPSQSDSNRVDSLTGTTRPSLPGPVAEDATPLTQDAPAAVDGAARRLILQQADCGECVNCLDKPKFGGPFTRRQACKLKLEKLKALAAGGACERLRGQAWSAAENDLLRSLAAEMTDDKGQPMWTTICQHLPGRSPQEVRGHTSARIPPSPIPSPSALSFERLLVPQARCRWSRIRAQEDAVGERAGLEDTAVEEAEAGEAEMEDAEAEEAETEDAEAEDTRARIGRLLVVGTPRPFVCAVPGCDKAYMDQQGLDQHHKLKHPELHQVGSIGVGSRVQDSEGICGEIVEANMAWVTVRIDSGENRKMRKMDLKLIITPQMVAGAAKS